MTCLFKLEVGNLKLELKFEVKVESWRSKSKFGIKPSISHNVMVPIRVVRRSRESLLLREKTQIVTILAPKLL